jgi:hypothetical protein
MRRVTEHGVDGERLMGAGNPHPNSNIRRKLHEEFGFHSYRTVRAVKEKTESRGAGPR